MIDELIIRDFLKSKPSYLKCGNERISNETGVADLELIKKIKKELKKQPVVVNPIAKVPQITPELIAEIAKQLAQSGLQIQSSKEAATPEEEVQSLIKRKQQLRGFHTPPVKDQIGMHILLGCNHVPFHNKQLHRGIIELIKDYPELKGFHLLGDFLDLNPLSSHDRGKFTAVPGLTLDDEYQIGSDLLYDFDAVLPKGVWKTYIYGNHEDRWNRWMASMDNAKTPLRSPEEGLRLWERGYNVKTSWAQDYVTLGNDFDIFHGIYFSIHNAKAHLDKLRRSCAYVHTHRMQMYREGKMAAYNIGSCADFAHKAFNYATRPMKQQWANGFAINMIDDDGSSHITQISVDSLGHFYFGGKKY